MNAVSTGACPREGIAWPTSTLLSMSVTVFGFLFALLLMTPGHPFLLDPDTLWHVGVGRQIVQTASLPWFDHLSHTFEGHSWMANDWLSEVIYYAAYEAGGWPAIVAVAASAVGLTFALLFAELGRQMRPAIALSIALYAFTLSSHHFSARPHLLSYPCLILWVAGLVRAVERRGQPNLLLIPVMTLWANLHGGFTLGLGVGGLLALEAISLSKPEHRLKTAFHWAIFLGAAALASFVTPYGYHSMLVTAQVFGGNEALDHINEWQGFDFKKDILGGALIIAPIFVSLLLGVKIRFMRLVIITILFYMMLVYVRLGSVFALVAALLIASSLTSQFPYLSLESLSRNEPYLFGWLIRAVRPRNVLILLTLLMGSSLFGIYARGVVPRENIYPAAAVDYILRADSSCQLYNDFNFGGYLVFRGVKTFIDGRTDQLFGGGFLSRAFDSGKKPNDDFLKLLNEYNVSCALVMPESDRALKLDKAPAWRRRYLDDVAAVYQRVAP
jgi:hypothetical protein